MAGSRGIPCLQNRETWGTQGRGALAYLKAGGLRFEVSHPNDRSKDVVRMGHPHWFKNKRSETEFFQPPVKVRDDSVGLVRGLGAAEELNFQVEKLPQG
jgi:hypothetical protein